jgi:uncharacterized protein with HEPN domain
MIPLIFGICSTLRSVLRFVGDTTFEEYLGNEVLQAAVERRIEIIGEAARRISDELKTLHPEIPWRGIIAQRHVLAHEYGEIDQRIIWNVIKESIPELITMLRPILPPAPDE